MVGLLVLSLAGCAGQTGRAYPSRPAGFRLVIVDAGHGGIDAGGRGNGLVEKELTLDTARRVQRELGSIQVHSEMTRTGDYFVELDDRVAIANRLGSMGAILLSIHYNASGPGAQGVTTFYWRTDSHGLATRVQRAVVRETGLHDNGIVRRRLRLTRNPEIPCILIECAYMTNKSDATKVQQAEFRQLIARGIVEGLREQFAHGDDGIPPVAELHEPLSRAADGRTY